MSVDAIGVGLTGDNMPNGISKSDARAWVRSELGTGDSRHFKPSSNMQGDFRGATSGAVRGFSVSPWSEPEDWPWSPCPDGALRSPFAGTTMEFTLMDQQCCELNRNDIPAPTHFIPPPGTESPPLEPYLRRLIRDMAAEAEQRRDVPKSSDDTEKSGCCTLM